MQLNAKIIFGLIISCSVLYIGAGYSLDYFDGLTFDNPNFSIFKLNPRVDRLIYWTLAEGSTFFSFFLLALLFERNYFLGKLARYILTAVQAYFLAEFFMVFITQFLLSGRSENHSLFIYFALLIYIYRIIITSKKVISNELKK